MKNGALVNQVLETSAGRAPDMTHALCSLGGGDMGAGIVALWDAGQRSGIIKGVAITTLVLSFGIGGGMALLHRHHENKLYEVEEEKADDCLDFTTSVHKNRCKKCACSQGTDEEAQSVTENKSTN